MYRIKPCIALAVGIVMVLCLSGCIPEITPDSDLAVSEITIINIPADIYVMSSGTPGTTNGTFKVYLNASNSMSETETDKAVAKGLAKIEDATEQANGKYTLTMRLQRANPVDGEDPNLNTGNWSGIAPFFSVMISPKNPTNTNFVWIKAGTGLDNRKRIINWDSSRELNVNFRNSIHVQNLGLNPRATALYNNIIVLDPCIGATTPCPACTYIGP